MFAVIKTGGKQYKVAPGDTLFVEKLPGEAGEIVALDQVLMLGDDKGTTVGTPLVEGATVAAEVLRQDRHAKIIVFKKKRRKNYRRTRGHRQETTVLQVTEILTGGKKPSGKLAGKAPAKAPAKAKKDEAAEAPAKTAEAPEAKKAAPKKAAAKKPAAKAPADKTGADKTGAEKAGAKKTEAKKAAPKKAAAEGGKKAPAKKAAAKKDEE